MAVDLDRAGEFMATHARVLDRHRFALAQGTGDPAAAVRAVLAYRNADGGFGWALEPDLRSPESQPAGALHAFEAIAESGLRVPEAVELCDWLAGVTGDDGGLPFALPVTEPAGCAPWWLGADAEASSLQITAAVAGEAHAVARHDPAVAAHPWLAAATAYCLGAIEALDEQPHALVLKFALNFLDRARLTDERAASLVAPLARLIPPSGELHVAGGTETELMRALDFAPEPDSAVRAHLDPDVVRAQLDALAAQQQPDGGWPVEWATASPASALEWRGYLTVRAVTLLRRNGRLA